MLHYTDEFICNENGIKCRVLDISKLDFSMAYVGRKKTETMIIKANGNEKIETVNSAGLTESTYITTAGDAIFANSEEDIYVPRDSSGKAWQFDLIESYGYEIVSNEFSHNGNKAVKVKSTKLAYLLPEIILMPTCIKDAWGQGSHQFLFEGATLKKDMENGRITGIEKGAFDETWEIIGNKGKKL